MAEAGELAERSERDVSLLTECTDILFQRRPRNLYSHPLVAILPLALGSTEAAWRSNLVLVGLLVGYTALALIQARRYNARPSSEAKARRAARSVYWELAFVALLYNAIFLNLHRHGIPHATHYLFLLTAAYCAGGAASYQHLRGLAMVFIVSVITPQVIYYLVSGESGGALTSFLLVLFGVFMSNTSADLNREAVERVELTRQLRAARDEAERRASTDGLTGLLNRRALAEASEGLVAAARRHERALSVVVLDLDRFKAINDRYGHPAGDAALVAVADVLRSETRATDLVGRMGGEEFAVVLADSDAGAAHAFAERVRAAVGALRIKHDEARIALTVSAGVAEREPDDGSLDATLHRADTALYRAKEAGRDRTVVYDSTPATTASATDAHSAPRGH